jgi:hypothetical protein
VFHSRLLFPLNGWRCTPSNHAATAG